MAPTRLRRFFLAAPAVPALVALATCTLGLVGACADSLHLDGSLVSDASADVHVSPVSVQCVSNTDCAYPTPLCDTAKNKCFECLTYADCADRPETVCSKGSCVCPPPDTSDAGAVRAKGSDAGTTVDAGHTPPTPAPALTYCPSAAAGQRCTDTKTSADNCGSCGHACVGSCLGGACQWEIISTTNAPSARSHHVAAWTGSKMFVWGGKGTAGLTNTGGLYDPVSQTWTATSLVNAPTARQDATAVWDDLKNVVVVWGGRNLAGAGVNTGAVFDPASNTWTPITPLGAPSPRLNHTAVWARGMAGAVANGMIVWGGTSTYTGLTNLSDGAIYDPALDSWAGAFDSAASDAGVTVAGRYNHTAVWDMTDGQMLAGGGLADDGDRNDFWAYTPAAGGGTWAPLSTLGAPGARSQHTAAWTGTAMLVFGGSHVPPLPAAQIPQDLNTGAQFKRTTATTGTWTPFATPPVPEARVGHTAVWIDGVKQMMVFGGVDDTTGGILSAGYVLNGDTLTWASIASNPTARAHHTAVVNGSSVLIWGGDADYSGVTQLNTGAIFNAAVNASL